MLPAGNLIQVTSRQQSVETQSSAPEDGRDYRLKHIELIAIIYKPLLLRLVGCLYYFINNARSYKRQTFIYLNAIRQSVFVTENQRVYCEDSNS